MKKILLLMTLVLLGFSLVGCRDDSDSSDGNGTLPVAYYSITGKVQTAGETPVGWEDVNVTLDGDKTLSTTTDADGNFAFSVPAGEYRITPMQAGIALNPLDHVFEVNTTNVSNINFTVAPSMASHATPTTGSMTYVRYMHTATLLPDGKVLITGGDGGFLPRASSELYYPK